MPMLKSKKSSVKSFEAYHEENSQILDNIKQKFGSNFKLKTKLKDVKKKQESPVKIVRKKK